MKRPDVERSLHHLASAHDSWGRYLSQSIAGIDHLRARTVSQTSFSLGKRLQEISWSLPLTGRRP